MRLIISFLLLCMFATAYPGGVLTNVSKKMKQMVLFQGSIDVNDLGSSTLPFQIGGFGDVGLFASISSGTFSGGAVIELQASPDITDDTLWFSLNTSSTELAGTGFMATSSLPFRYIRASMKTIEGAAGALDIFMQAK